MDTKGEHRTHAEGSPRGNPYDLTYSPSGRLIEKYRNNHSVTTSATVDMHYSYCDDYQPHAVRHIFDEENMTHCDLRWDPAGNLGQISVSLKDNVFDHGRFLFWTVDNRMHAAVDDKHYSYYTYDYTGERRLKLTGESNRLDVNADFMTTGTLLNTPTLYPSAYLVLTSKGYTKHYYAGADRVAASLGGGGLKAVGSNPGMKERADWLFWESHERVNGRMLQENDHECIWQSSLFTQEYYESIKDIPGRMNASVEFYLNDLYYNLKMLAEEQHDEKDVYFYHSDHLGSANWITDGSGIPVQHLQYLPFGEPFVDQHPAGYQERFRFTGKERDEETGYGYFGARYMDHELTAMWLSVDPMADKYPSISPYAYCAWNPIKLVDPDGREIDVSNLSEAIQKRLVNCLNKITGLSLYIDDGKLNYKKDENGNAIFTNGSKTARGDLIEAIDKKNNDGSNYKIPVGPGAMCEGKQLDDKQSGFVKMFCSQMKETEDAKTNGLGMVFLHELRHAVTGEKDVPEDEVSAIYDSKGNVIPNCFKTGPVVDRVNIYREELDMPIRLQYVSRKKDGRVPFCNLKKYGGSPANILRHTYYLKLNSKLHN